MPNKKRHSFNITPVSVSLTESGELDGDSLRQAAEEVGISPENLTKIFRYGRALRENAVDMDMEPAHVMTAMLQCVGELIMDVFPENDHADICTDIFHQLWRACDLPSDIGTRKHN